MHKKTVAIIPARGGSKRFPRKNVVDFCGQPLITHSIQYARKCNEIDQTFVSTDSDEIARIAGEAGASILHRPSTLAEDGTPTAQVVAHHVKEWQKQGTLPEWIILLQPTNPIRPPALVRDAFQFLHRSGRDSLVTFSPLNRKFGFIRDHYYLPENYVFGQRSQDIEPRYFENGLLYIVRGNLAAEGNLFGSDPYPLITEGPEGYVDIDGPDDLLYAEFVFKKLKYDSF